MFTNKILGFLLILILLVYILNIDANKHADEDEEDVVDIGVRLTGDNRDSLIADLIAEERNILNAGLVDGVDLYHFQVRRKRNHRSKRAIDEAVEDLKLDERVKYVTVGETLEREKRDFMEDDEIRSYYDKYRQIENNQQSKNDNNDNIDTSNFKMVFNDVLYQKQWYLENVGQLNTPPHHDINIAPAWLAGYTGKNITICIIDDGVDHLHVEINEHYQAQFSYDLNDLKDPKHDPFPRTNDSQNNHGTRCAGAAAGIANNEICGVGSAPNAYISAIRLLDGRITTLLEARGITLFAVDTHIKSASWGPTDDGTKMEAPGTLVNSALNYGVTHGRNGKGTLYVWASGNGGAAGDDCGADGYVSHHNVISIGSINHLGKTTYFGESCPSTMAVAYTGGRHSPSRYEKALPVGIVAADVGGKCTTSFFGTSAAAPVAAGAFALVLEANPELSYRDVMHIITQTARIPTLSETDDWVINGAGFHVSDKFGFGVLDVGQMVALAQKWTNVQPRYECYQELIGVSRKLPIGEVIEIPINIVECEPITSLEHIVVNISYSFHRRGDVKITIISPSKTPSELLSFRNPDATDKGIKFFPFLSAHHWGERPTGVWILRIETRQPQNAESKKSVLVYGDNGEVSHIGLRLYGSFDLNDKTNDGRKKRGESFAFVPTQDEVEALYKRELAARESPLIMNKRDYQNLIKERRLKRTQEENHDQEDRSFFGLFRRAFAF